MTQDSIDTEALRLFCPVVRFKPGDILRQKGQQIGDLEGRNILVFDWGGGTLDITLAAVTTGIVAFLYGVHTFVNEEGVKLQAFTYARQLLHTAYKAKSDPKPPAKGGDGG